MKKNVFLTLFLAGAFFLSSSQAYDVRPSMTANDNQFIFISSPTKKAIQIYDSYGFYIKDSPSQEKFSEIQKIVSCPCGGYLLVVDSGKKEMIVIDDMSGAIIHRIQGIQSFGDITVSREKMRVEGVVNLSTNSIHLYSDKGVLLRIIKGSKLFKEASSIHLNFQNHLFVADNASHTLIELDVKGDLVRTIQGTDFSFTKILDITSDQSGNLYVLDEGKGLYKFSSLGKKIKNIPYPTSFKPYEIALDNNDSSLYLFSDKTLQKISLDLKDLFKIQDPLQALKKTIIQLRIGSRILIPIGFDAKVMDSAPFIEISSNRTFVPLRIISESFKAQVFWNAKLNQVTIQKKGIQILLMIGSITAKVNGLSQKLEAPPQIKDDRTFVPLRFIGEAFSAEIVWMPESKTIRIISPFVGS